jgi:hypothetical protein
MDDDDAIILIILSFVAAAHQLICSYSLLFDDLATVKEKKSYLKESVSLHHTSAMCPTDTLLQHIKKQKR